MGIAKEICRIEKIKSVGALGGAYLHNLRLKDIPNADEAKASFNFELTERLTGKSYVDCFHDKIRSSPWYENGRHKIAKNAVYAVEFMLTFGGEANEKIDIDTWCHDNMKWLSSHFGGAQNVLSAILHLDERTPHIHAIIIPLDEKGKLNYTKYLGGSKYRLSELQDNYHAEVGQLHNLDRGIKGSKAHHQDIDNFYSMVNKTISPVALPDPEQKAGLFKRGETAAEYQERIIPLVQHAHSVSVSYKLENELLKKRISEIEHLQEGVVSVDLYNKTFEELQNTKHQLEKQKKKTVFTAAGLQTVLEDQKAKFEILKQDFDRLMKDYTALQTKYTDVQGKYSILKEKSRTFQKLEYDRELMYAILDNNGISHIYDRHRKNMDGGLMTSATLEIATYKKRHRPHNQRPITSYRTDIR